MTRAEIAIRHCSGLAEMEACLKVQRIVWAESDLEVVPSSVFIVAARTGGQVLGAFDGGQLVGFTLAMAGVRGGKPYLHSHMSAVLDSYRNRGVGRRLKLFQREDALARGIRLVEWTFDPLEMRNAHFNLNRLGAIARQIHPNLYGLTTSPLHRGLPTDRLLAEWHLDSPRVEAALNGRPPRSSAEKVEIVLPENLEGIVASGRDATARIQERVRGEFQHWFDRGYAATATIRSAAGNCYALEPWRES